MLTTLRRYPVCRPFPSLLLSLAVAGCAATAPPGQVPGPGAISAWPIEHFCTEAQRLIGNTRLESNNIVHTDYDAFVLSKAQIRPLQTEQYHWYEDAARQRLKMISCKMKTKDHLRAEYGDSETGDEGECATVNRRSLQVAIASARSGARRLGYDGGNRIVFDAEERTNVGPEWLKAHEIAWEDARGVLHVQSRAMRNDWLDPRYAGAPVRFRGTRYCHLMAPEYFERLLTGASIAPRARGEPVSKEEVPPTPAPR